jgi:hypothetical protein
MQCTWIIDCINPNVQVIPGRHPVLLSILGDLQKMAIGVEEERPDLVAPTDRWSEEYGSS